MESLSKSAGSGESFRATAWPVWRVVSVWFLMLGAGAAGLDAMRGMPFRLPPPIPVASAIGVLLLLGGLVWIFPYRVLEDRLEGYDAQGGRLRFEWWEIASARKSSLLGMTFLRLTSLDRPDVMWLPLFLRNMDRFRENVTKHAGADHPLAEALERFRTRKSIEKSADGRKP
jgi:hypothetical protein